MKRYSKTRGAHYYQGRQNSRAKRLMSKLHKGLDTGNVQKAFEKLDKEKNERNMHSL